MTASAAGELIDKYGADIVAKGLNKLGIDGDRIKKLTGIDLTVTGICFTGDTLILTQEGHKQISEIEIGDEVYSENVETGEIGLKPVKNVFVREVKTLLHISVDSYECEAIIKTTMVHPFYVVNVGWVEAQDLVVGDLLKLVPGEEVVVSDIQGNELETPVKVYNFEVADWHTYYVSEFGVSVHNKGSNSCGEFGDELVEGTGNLGKLTNIGDNAWESSAGLIYGADKKFGNRVKHVLAHGTPNPAKANHTVFNVGGDEILGLVDEAWIMKGNPLANDPGAYLVDMGRTIGTNGETTIKVIVKPGTSEIITAYPVR